MTDTASAAPSEREQFEAHMRSLNACVRLERHREWLGGHYRAVTVQRAWDLWQTARRTQPTPPAVVEPPHQPKRTVTYVCPVCAASLERQE